ncbi:hypothetical protein NQ315_007820 [Exocentrus adspersus]|uniref:Apolipoprotein L3 n=1 Tax=Exocentrus adspersus TaxID=1586481 RepID=A0AAV8W9A3_9CUCU|nr:hypothetical protein NQ315_007820 [Exocentrus adspersus]
MDLRTSNSSDFEELLKNHIDKLDEILAKLNDLLTTIESHHKACNIAKTTGTVLSSTGVTVLVASVLLSPFTGGSSLAIGAGGVTMSITGGLSNVITDYVDYKTSASIMSEIQAVVKSKEEFDENLRKQLKHLGIVIEKLMESGVDKCSAILIAMKGIASGCIDLTEEPNMKLMNALSTAVKMYHIDAVAKDVLPVLGKALADLSQKASSYWYLNNIFGLSKHSALFVNLGRISSAISVVFTVVDITLLVKDWMTEHPTAEVVAKVTAQLREEKEVLSDLLKVIDASRDKVDVIYQKVIKEIEKIEEQDDCLEDFVVVPTKTDACVE